MQQLHALQIIHATLLRGRKRQIPKTYSTSLLQLSSIAGDLFGDPARPGHDIAQRYDNQRREFAAYQDDKCKEGHAADVMGGTGEELELGACERAGFGGGIGCGVLGGKGGLDTACEGPVGLYVQDAGLVKGYVGFPEGDVVENGGLVGLS